MALVASIHITPGWKMPVVDDLQDTDGHGRSLQSCMGAQGMLVVFTCNHCPYALAIWPRLIREAKLFHSQGINTVAINPNIHPDYPEDSPAAMKEKIKQWGIDFPYLTDESQQVSRTFDAQCTPDIYLFNNNHTLYYHGRMDDSWKDEAKVSQRELASAVDAMITQAPIPEPQHPTIGCSIKWKHP